MKTLSHLLVVHESPLLRDCLASVLSDEAQIAIAFDHTRKDWIDGVANARPDVVIVDIGLPEKQATTLIAHLRRTLPTTAVVAIVSDPIQRNVVEAVAAGATVCVPEQANLDELRIAIRHANCGESYCSPAIASSILARLSELAQSTDWVERAEAAVLSSREFEVLRLIAEGNLSNKQIARRLAISLYTVKNHVHNILEKLAVESRYAAAEYARERAWI